ncbi:MAG: hypothetical protein ACT6FF_07380 [Methanosarcinaceae archaeon]
MFAGIVSLFIGMLLNGGLFGILLSLLICSYLLHYVIKYYSNEKYSSTFVFVTFAASILIFLIGFIGGAFLPLQYSGYFGPFFLLLIILATGSIIFKNDRHMRFALTAFTISFATIFLVFGATFALAEYNHINSTGISAHLLQTAPDEFVVLTEQDLNEYPAIRDAITNHGTVEVKLDEWEQIRIFLDEKGSYAVKFGDEYYKLGFSIA